MLKIAKNINCNVKFFYDFITSTLMYKILTTSKKILKTFFNYNGRIFFLQYRIKVKIKVLNSWKILKSENYRIFFFKIKKVFICLSSFNFQL